MNNQNNLAYGLSAPEINVFPEPIKARRAPTVNDKAAIGTLWIDQAHNQAYTLTSIANNAANWSTNTTLGVGVFVSVEATGGDITADVGDLVATVGDVLAGGAVVAGTGLTVTTGDLGVLVGDLTVNTGNLIITTGNFRVTAGDIDTVVGDINSAAAITAGTTITSVADITSTTGALISTAGNIVATVGNVVAGGTISAGTGISTTAGGITATAGNIVATAGDINATVGSINAGLNVNVGGDVNVTGTVQAVSLLAGPTGVVSAQDYLMADLGQLRMHGVSFLHAGNFPTGFNTYLGLRAGSTVLAQGAYNVGIGGDSMQSLLLNNLANVGVGYESLKAMTTGKYNIAIGAQAMTAFTLGERNIAIGRGALGDLVGSATYNIAIGYEAGINYTTVESSNICIGNAGIPGEFNVMRLGTDGAAPGQVNKCYIAGDVSVFRSITAQVGNVTASTGNFVASTPGKGVVLGGGASVVCGAGDPNGVVTAAKGSLYLNLTGSGVADRAWINTDAATTWTNITTAA